MTGSQQRHSGTTITLVVDKEATESPAWPLSGLAAGDTVTIGFTDKPGEAIIESVQRACGDLVEKTTA